MGGLLSQPLTEKGSDHGEGLGLKYGLSSMQGWRPEMEDAHDVKIGLDYGLDDWSFFAVFDGHAGKYAAAYAAVNLLEHILRDSEFELGIEPVCIDKTAPVTPSDANKPNLSEGPTKNDAPDNQLIIQDDSSQVTSEPTKEPSQEGKQDDVSSKNDAKTNQVENVPKPKFISSPVIEQLDMVKNAIRSGFLRIDQNMRVLVEDTSGCTAVCALISPTHLFIANCGDSRAVLFDGVRPKFATEDHKPFHPKEKQRIVEAGGTATVRINGTLAVSRALGDFEFKKDNRIGPCEQLVSPEPEVTIIERHPKDEFLILACDGIWDVMNNEELCEYVRYKLTTDPNLENICSSVLDVCLRKGSRDNMSIIIVVFETGPKVDEQEVERDKKNDEALLEFIDSSLIHELEKNKSLFFHDFLNELKTKLDEHSMSKIVPPGAGVEGKYDLLQEKFDKIYANFKENDE